MFILFVFSCTPKNYYQKQPHLFYIEHTKLERLDYTFPCNPDLVDKVNTNWLKHGQFHCYKFNEFVQNFPQNYKDCVTGKKKDDIIRLLGKPSKEEDNKMIFTISPIIGTCKEYMKTYAILWFSYDDDAIITDVKFGSAGYSH